MDIDDAKNSDRVVAIMNLLLDPERSRVRYWALLSDDGDLHNRAAAALADTKRFGLVAQDTRTLPGGTTISLVRLREQVFATSVRGALGEGVEVWKVGDIKALGAALRELPSAVPGVDVDGDGLATALFKFGDGGAEWSGKTIRCTNTVPRKADVWDVLCAIGFANPRDKLQAAFDADQTLIDCVAMSDTIDQKHQRPIADAKGLVRIILALNGPKVAAFKSAAAELLVRYLGGDETLVNEVRANRALQESLSESSGARMFGEYVESGAAGGSEGESALYFKTVLDAMTGLVSAQKQLIDDQRHALDDARKTIMHRDTTIDRMSERFDSDPTTINSRVLPDDPDSTAMSPGCEVLRGRILGYANGVANALFENLTSGPAWKIRVFAADVLNVQVFSENQGHISIVRARTCIQAALKMRVRGGWGHEIRHCTEMSMREAYTVFHHTAAWMRMYCPIAEHTYNFGDVVQLMLTKYPDIGLIEMGDALVV
ncbi:hypothetical protein GHT06_003827 [Daphnia sinensis]|uniref:Uncharacterized protein n=1 Tax=Daphnia sinensis TaxID=1820382 RepID=A0AAD5KTT6_9CRUS|nr:hypothetical protein GHT06_003827 [Daphnia sinensis]